MTQQCKFKIICRLCGEESSELIRLHIRQPKQRNLKDSIKKYLGVKVAPNDGLPDQVCGPCLAKLDETSEFIDKCVKTQRIFENIVAECEEEENFEIKNEPWEGESSLCAESLVNTILKKDSNNSVLEPGMENSNSSDQPQIYEKCVTLNDDEENSHIGETAIDTLLNENELEHSDQEEQSTDTSASPNKKDKEANPAIHKCNQCTKSYSKQRSLKTHQRRVHEKSMEKCPKCEKVLSSNYLWQYHILVHSDARPHPCKECHKTFKTKHEATKHMKTHIPIEDRYNFSCEICGKRFTNKGNLSTHIKLHSDERPFVCDQCGKSFRHKGSLEDHQLAHKGEKSFVCNICSKGFFRVQALAVHERCHTGSRPFFCSQCAKSFRSAKVLKRHELIHTDARPYPCQYCGKGFRDHGKRKVHERIHTGERPYECSLCPVAFYESGNLKKHLQKVHKQPKSIHIRLRKDDSTTEDKIEYATTVPSFSNPPEPMEQMPPMTSNPLLGHTIFSNNTMGMGFHHGHY